MRCGTRAPSSRRAKPRAPAGSRAAGASAMRALCWHDRHDVLVETVPEPKLINPRDAIVRVTLSAICGSDLHLYGGFVPGMVKGDILGHEFMGEVVEVGAAVKNLRAGERVVVPFPIACGNCFFCAKGLFSLCENSNPNAWMAEKLWGYSPCGIYGYSHLLGGYAGGQAEYVRVPYADVGPLKVPQELRDEQALFLSDILPTGYMAAENCAIERGDTIAVSGFYGGWIDKFPAGALMNRSLTIRTGQTHVHRYLRPLLERITKGEIDPSFVITHRLPLDQAPAAYRMFRDKQDECIKVVLTP